jgi:hypothetical protein
METENNSKDHRVWISELTFSDGSTLELGQDDIIVVVGPNNSGKSEALRGINQKLINPLTENPVVRNLKSAMYGERDGLATWLMNRTKVVNDPPGNPQYQGFGTTIHHSQATAYWTSPENGLQALAPFFCKLLNAEGRIGAVNPPQNIALGKDAPNHPIHFLQLGDELELKISEQFHKAFDQDLIVNRNAGNIVPLHVGKRPVPPAGKDRVSVEYATMLRQLPELVKQGDGMRSFAGVLLHTSVGQESIFLLDEPEAFLHPPQARLLGRMLVDDKQVNRQLFIATHSGDVLKGILDSGSKNVRVVRLRREGDTNIMRQLDNARIAELWGDPLLRHSDILDGLFHEKVVITEGDADARFFAALMNSQADAGTNSQRYPSVMFTHCGGKGRLPLVTSALAAVEVPVVVVADFDILSEEEPLSKLVEITGGTWSALSNGWKQVKSAIASKRPELKSADVKKEIETILLGITADVFPPAASKEVKGVLARSSPWSVAKTTGKAFIPSGGPTVLFDELQTKLEALGIFIVDVGELECFWKKSSAHGPAWVNEVLKLDLVNDPELQAARTFVAKMLAWKKSETVEQVPITAEVLVPSGEQA